MQLGKGEILKVNERYTRPRLTPHVQCVPAATDPQSSAAGAPGAYASSIIAECLDALKPCLTATKKKKKKKNEVTCTDALSLKITEFKVVRTIPSLSHASDGTLPEARGRRLEPTAPTTPPPG